MVLQDTKLSNGFQSTLTVAPGGTGRVKVAVTIHDGALGSAGSTTSAASPGPGLRRAVSHETGAGNSRVDAGRGALATETATASIDEASASREGTSSRQWKSVWPSCSMRSFSSKGA